MKSLIKQSLLYLNLFGQKIEIGPMKSSPFQLNIIKARFEDNLNRCIVSLNDNQIGTLTDNSYVDDGYRFHDILHLSFFTFLNWSPVTDSLLGHNELRSLDNTRAKMREEVLVFLIFDYAQKHRFLDKSKTIDSKFLDTILSLSQDFESSHCSKKEWKRAILEGFKAWRHVRANNGGNLTFNSKSKQITFSTLL